MTGIVFNQVKKPLDWGWESYALRTSLCLFQSTVCLGPSVYTIIYEHTANRLNTDNRLRIIIRNSKDEDEDEDEKKRLIELSGVLKFLRKRKHPKKQEIVMLKQTEKIINQFYDLYLEQTLIAFKKFGLPQLAPFYFEMNKTLNLWYVNNEGGEKEKDGELSEILCFKVKDDKTPEPDVFIFYERLAHEVIKSHKLTPLAVLPNLNMLETDKLQNVRAQLKPMRNELETLLPLKETDEHGNLYYAGTWNMEGIKAFAPRLQEALDSMHELEWANNLHSDLQSELHVGNMDTLELWQLLRENDFIPDDTWEVLEQKRKSGIHCTTTAIMTITSNWGAKAIINLTEEETLGHKRKTINLD